MTQKDDLQAGVPTGTRPDAGETGAGTLRVPQKGEIAEREYLLSEFLKLIKPARDWLKDSGWDMSVKLFPLKKSNVIGSVSSRILYPLSRGGRILEKR